jgi:hypothetical protein
MPAFDYAYEAGRAPVPGLGKPKGDYLIAVGLPAIPLFHPQSARETIAGIVLDTLRLALLDIAGHVSDRAPVDSGQLAQSFGSDPATPTGGVEITGTDLLAGVSGRVFSSLPYAIVMEEGRRPGAPISLAGIDAIGLWAQRKLGLSAEEAASAKFAIANYIVGHGIEGKRFAEAGFEAARPGVEAMFVDLAASISQALTTAKGGQ